mgnify:CR=1 FL=1|nr:MAG TPA: hypothetical protein [Caudoviricetes sp.]
MERPKYYVGIDYDEIPCCAGCGERELEVKEDKLMAGDIVVETYTVIRCKHIEKCRHILDHIRGD